MELEKNMSQEEQIQISRLRMLCERVVKASSDWNNRAETQYKALNDQIRNVNSIADQLLVLTLPHLLGHL